MFELSNCTLSIAGRTLIDQLDLRVPPGHRIAVVGENGAGKTTLLRLLAGEIAADDGTVRRPAGPFVLLRQTPVWPAGTTVEDVRQVAVAWAEELVGEVERAGAALAETPSPAGERRLSRAVAAAEAAQAWTADAAVEARAAALGVDQLPPARPVARLSGGQRARLQLLATMTTPAAGYLLDEPTNHLDDEAVVVVTAWLRDLEAPVVFTSHDRALIDDVASGVLDLDPVQGHPTVVPGGWTAYRSNRAHQRVAWEGSFQSHRAEVAAARADLRTAGRPSAAPRRRDNDKFIPHRAEQSSQATRGARARNARRRLAALEGNPVRKPPRTLQLHTPSLTGRRPPTGVVLSAVDVEVHGRVASTRLDVSAGDRVLVTGPNGVGKSTLLAVLAGCLQPTLGQVLTRPGARVTLLDQDVPAVADPITTEAWYRRRVGEEAPELVTLGLVRPADLQRDLRTLSVGQRRRLALAVTIASAPDVLLLDEPTDHLSPTLVEELEEAMAASPGAIVVASHDRWLRARWQGEVLDLSAR